MPAHKPEELHALIEAAVNAGDLDSFIDLHEEHATTVVPPEGRQVSGRAEIRTALAPIFAAGPRIRDEFIQKLQSDELALTHARIHLIGTRQGEQVDIHGRGTIVSRRQDDGAWKIVLANPMSPA